MERIFSRKDYPRSNLRSCRSSSFFRHNRIWTILRCSDVVDAIILTRHPSTRNCKIHNMIMMHTSRTRHDTRLKENVSSIKQIWFFSESWSQTFLWFLLLLFSRFLFLTFDVRSFIFVFVVFLSFWRFIFHIFHVSFKKHRLISFSASSIHESFRVSFLRVWISSVSVSLFLFFRLVFW